jgi:hypothetical protein
MANTHTAASPECRCRRPVFTAPVLCHCMVLWPCPSHIGRNPVALVTTVLSIPLLSPSWSFGAFRRVMYLYNILLLVGIAGYVVSPLYKYMWKYLAVDRIHT